MPNQTEHHTYAIVEIPIVSMDATPVPLSEAKARLSELAPAAAPPRDWLAARRARPICENPVVVAAAADELGPDCPPLVCVNGRPSAAVWRLLELLRAGGAQFAYHGDFDWGGIGIATAVYQRVGWTPWRYSTADYLAASGSAELTGRPQPTSWEPELSEAMHQRGIRVEEELVLGDLLTDFRSVR